MSFVRRSDARSRANLRGARANVRGAGGKMTSSGIRDLDEVLGGGIPLGSVVCMQEVGGTGHLNAILACFIAQGFEHDHAVAIAAADEEPANVARAVPARQPGYGGPPPEDSGPAPTASASDLKIAWRYAQSSAGRGRSGEPSRADGSAYFHAFDLGRGATWDLSDKKLSLLGLGDSVRLDEILDKVALHIRAAERSKVVARIVVRALGTELWEGDIGTFLRRLRSMVRCSNACCVLTCTDLTPEMEHYTDVSVVLDTNDGLGTSALGLGEYLGTLQLRRNCSPFSIHTDSSSRGLFVFWRGRRSYHIEEAHAAPEENDITSFESGKGLLGPGQSAVDF